MSSSDWLNVSAPLDADGNFDRCRIFDVDFSNVDHRPDESTPTRSCHDWEFADEPFTVRLLELREEFGSFRG